MSDDAFWELTPAQFSVLSTRKEEDDKRHDFRFGMLISTVINMFSGKEHKTLGPLEVMGYNEDGELGGEATPKEHVQSSTETELRFRLLEAAQKLAGGSGRGRN